MKKRANVGGQAVIEGVMIKSDNHVSVSVRNEKGKIINKTEPLKRFKWQMWRWPFVRGIVNLIEMLRIGLEALSWSANQQIEEEEEFSTKELIFVIGSALLFGLGFFVIIPFYLTKWITEDYGIWFNLLDGIIRIIFFLIYIFLIAMMDDIKLLFKYHGAEHMAVNCYENNEKLKVENVKKYTTLHPRCGTSFVMIVFIVSIFVFSIIVHESWAMKLLLRIMLIPVIAGISYEILKLGDKHRDSIITKIMVWPGVMMQKVTTSRPDDKQIEVAIDSLKRVLKAEGIKDA